MLSQKASSIVKQVMEEGRNCCEAVLAAANSVWNLDLDQDIMASALFFEEGMGRGCTCGALVGMVIVSGIMERRFGHSLGRNLPKKLHDRFKEEFGSTCCRVIVKKRSLRQRLKGKAACIELTSRAAALLIEEWTSENGTAPNLGYNSNL